MSDSRKKHPIVGNTTAQSEKQFKAREHRRERAAVRAALDNGDELPNRREFGNPWAGDKDGKHYWPDPRAYRK